MWGLLSIIMIILYMISVTIGLTMIRVKRIIQSLIWSRILYILTFTCQLVITIRIFHNHPYSAILSDIIAITLFILTEINFSNKQQTHLYGFNITLLVIMALSLLSITVFNIQ